MKNKCVFHLTENAIDCLVSGDIFYSVVLSDEVWSPDIVFEAWMQTWMLHCQMSGVLSRTVLYHVCKHAVKFLEASNALNMHRSAIMLTAITLISLGQVRHTACALNAEFVHIQ